MSNEQKHTPGPWCLHLGGNCLVMRGHTSLAYGSGEITQVFEKAIGREEAEANARLIAASPELLEALEWAVSVFDDPSRVLDSRRLNAARAAIAKATR